MFYYLTSTIAAVATGCISAFSLFWGALCILFGGPEGRIGHEAVMFGLLFVALGLITAWATRILFIAPNKEEPRPALFNFALKGSPFLALLFVGLLGMIGKYVLFYSLVVIGVVLGARLTRRR
jgi:hypothetical protein